MLNISVILKRYSVPTIFLVLGVLLMIVAFKQNQTMEFKNININSRISPSIEIKSGDNLMFENIFINSKMIDIKNFTKIAAISKNVMNLKINKIKIN
jgi:hypothetical protein